MSNRGAHVQDSFVIERRLRPIYDWLDAGSYKKAIQECDKVLKKSSNLHRVKALKALALLRMGKETDGRQMLDAIRALKPTDDPTLQAMTACYKELQQLQEICMMYEDAIKVEPTNEELLSHLFMAYARISDYKNQQLISVSLHRLNPKKAYYCWTIMSVILQAKRGEGRTDKRKREILLWLAQSMINKVMSENKEDSEPIRMYIVVLEAMGEYEKIIEVLRGPMGKKIGTGDVLDTLPYYVKGKFWADVNMTTKTTLLQNMDRWEIWKYYLKSAFELEKTSPYDVTSWYKDFLHEPDHLPERMHEFVCKLVENGAGYSLRGPYLARFELAKMLHEAGRRAELDKLLGDLGDLFVEYFRKFGQKPCVALDLRAYLPLLTPAQRLELGGKLIKEVGISATSVPSSEEQMQRHIGALQLSRLCGGHGELQYEHAMALVTAFAFHYQHGHQSFGKGLLPTDPGPSDAYVLLAAHLLYDLHAKTETSWPLFLALMLLENALRNSPSNFNIKLLVLRINHVLGSYEEAQRAYESLDVKHLQLDSMCHVHCAHLALSGHFGSAGALYDQTLKFFSSNYRDSADHLTYSYKFGSFTKLTEFMDFRERMNNSYSYLAIAADKMFLAIQQCATAEATFQLQPFAREPPESYDLLRNNDDLSVYASWDPERTEAPLEEWQEHKLIYEQNVHLLQIRVAILQCVGHALQYLKLDIKEDLEPARRPLINTLAAAERYCEELERKEYQPVKQRCLSLTQPSRLEIFQESRYAQVLLSSLKVVIEIELDPTAEECAKAIEAAKSSFSALSSQTFARLEETPSGKADPYIHNRRFMQALCNYVEIASVVVLLAMVSMELYARLGARFKKKKLECRSRDEMHGLVTLVRDALRRVDAGLENLARSFATPATRESDADEPELREVMERLATLNITAAKQEAIVANVYKSNDAAVRTLRAVLKSKLKLLNAPS